MGRGEVGDLDQTKAGSAVLVLRFGGPVGQPVLTNPHPVRAQNRSAYGDRSAGLRESTLSIL
jgi:hypothetical protein